MMMLKVQGTKAILSKLKASNALMQGQFIMRLGKAGLYLQRESQKIVPVNVGNLRASAFTRVLPLGWRSDCIVGYTAKYAVYVHENLDAVHGKAYNQKYAMQIANKNKGFRKKRPDEQAKFLEKPARVNRDMILKILAGTA